MKNSNKSLKNSYSQKVSNVISPLNFTAEAATSCDVDTFPQFVSSNMGKKSSNRAF